MIPIKTEKVKITSSYGKRHYKYRGKTINDFHHGIDLIGGSDILAFEDGTVTSLVNEGKQYGTGCYVRIKHTGGYYTLYYHLKTPLFFILLLLLFLLYLQILHILHLLYQMVNHHNFP